MLKSLTRLVHPFMLALPPEQAHEAALRALEAGLYATDAAADAACLGVDVWGLRFPNPLGIAAGFDKDARVPDAVLGMGCGFAECGTITPLPQPGNPVPRLFRLPRDRAVINRLGFNSGGHAGALAAHAATAAARHRRHQRRRQQGQRRPCRRLRQGHRGVHDVASYFCANISSPNTPGLRDLQAPAALDQLLGRLMAARQKLVDAGRPSRPIVVKIAPDVAEADLEPILDRMLAHKVDGIAVGNTTLSRKGLLDADVGREAGGLSGPPLFHRSTAMLARVYRLTHGKVPLIGIGGIASGETALAKIEAGATLIQVYTGLIFEGPALIGSIKRHLAAAATTADVASVQALVGRRAAEWAAKPVDG